MKNLVDLKEEDDGAREEDILIGGTVFKQQEIKPTWQSSVRMEVQPVHTAVYTAETDS